MFSEEHWSELVTHLSLTERQAQVVRWIIDGLSDKQIAVAMDISIAGVRHHMREISGKLKTHGRTQLILAVLHQFLEVCREAQCPRC